MTNEEREKLLKMAKNYNKYEFARFSGEVGWENWMNDWFDDDDPEYITERKIAEIDNVLEAIFDEAHGISKGLL